MAGRSKSKSSRSKSKSNGALTVQPSADDFEELKAVGVRCGIDVRAMEQLVERLQGRPPSPEGRLKLDDTELLSLIDDKLARAFQNLDEFSLGQSSARDLSVTIGVLTDKRKLLKPDNGPITTYQDYQKLDDFLAEVAKELMRRGELIEVTPTPAAVPVANGGTP